MMTLMTWFLILNVADVLLTLYVLKHGGTERNPILAKWFADESPDVVLVRIKALLLSVVWVATHFGALPEWALWTFVIAYFALVGYNINSAMKVYERTHD